MTQLGLWRDNTHHDAWAGCPLVISAPHLSQVDDEFIGWMREAYAVGAGAHLRD